jgi:hypothetical protein
MSLIQHHHQTKGNMMMAIKLDGVLKAGRAWNPVGRAILTEPQTAKTKAKL